MFESSEPAGVDGFFFSEHKNPVYDFLRKGSKAMGLVSALKEPQAEIKASEQNLSDFSRYL